MTGSSDEETSVYNEVNNHNMLASPLPYKY